MTDTVSEFKARVARLRERYPEWREGQAVAHALCQALQCRNTYHAAFCDEAHHDLHIRPAESDEQIPAFIPAAVKAGVLDAPDAVQEGLL